MQESKLPYNMASIEGEVRWLSEIAKSMLEERNQRAAKRNYLDELSGSILDQALITRDEQTKAHRDTVNFDVLKGLVRQAKMRSLENLVSPTLRTLILLEEARAMRHMSTLMAIWRETGTTGRDYQLIRDYEAQARRIVDRVIAMTQEVGHYLYLCDALLLKAELSLRPAINRVI